MVVEPLIVLDPTTKPAPSSPRSLSLFSRKKAVISAFLWSFIPIYVLDGGRRIAVQINRGFAHDDLQ